MRTPKTKRLNIEKVLGKLQEQGTIIRDGKTRAQIRYPADFKASVVEVIHSGIKIKLLSQRLGVSGLTLKAWLEASLNVDSAKNQKVRELTLVPEFSKGNDHYMKVRFGDRICVEIPMSALERGLLRDLAMLGEL